MVFDKNPGDFERWTNDNILNHIESIKEGINKLEFSDESR